MKNSQVIFFTGILSAAIISTPVRAAEWDQFRGPSHNGSTTEKIRTPWAASGLKEIWKTPLTDGFSSFAVAGGKAFTLVTRDVDGANQEVCLALDAKTGKELWATPLGIAKYDGGGDSGTPSNKGGDGPRSTPAFSDGKVYTYSSRMVLNCFEADSGKKVWGCDVIKEHGGQNIHWESAASPLVVGDAIYLAGGGPGEALLAFDKKDGHVLWKTGDDKLSHSTPVLATILGTPQIIFYTQSGLVSVDPKTGAEFWRYPFSYKTSGAISPVVYGDTVYISAAYNVGTAACKIAKSGDKFTASELWSEPANVIQNHWSTPVVYNGYIYGISGQAKFGKAPLTCVELASGKVMWSQAGFGPGGVNLVDGQVLVLSDAGDLVLVKADPSAYAEVSRAHILAGKCWNGVAISDGRLYARSTTEGVCLDVAP